MTLDCSTFCLIYLFQLISFTFFHYQEISGPRVFRTAIVFSTFLKELIKWVFVKMKTFIKQTDYVSL